MEKNGIMHKLKMGTAAQHSAVEAVSFSARIMSGELTLPEYTGLITGNYITHHYLEEKLRTFIADDHPLNPGSREKLGHLLLDLQALGIDKSEIDLSEAAAHAPAIDTLPQALGCMYVMEGATLGGNIMLKALSKHPLLAGIPKHYYGCYGENTGTMWRSFTDFMSAASFDEREETDVLLGARTTFDFYLKVFSGINQPCIR